MNRYPRCSCVNVDNTQCGRRVKDGSNPPVCHIHKAKAQGLGNGSGLVPPAQRSIEDIVRKIAMDHGHSNQMAALRFLREIERETPPESTAEWVKDLNESERALLADALHTVRLLKARALAFHNPAQHGGPMTDCDCALCEPLPTDPPRPAPVAADDDDLARGLDAADELAEAFDVVRASELTEDEEPTTESTPVTTYPRLATNEDALRIRAEYGWDLTDIIEYEPGQFRWTQKE